MQSRRVLEAVSGFTNPYSSIFEDNELYVFSFNVPAKPGIAKKLIEADDIGRKAVADFIDSRLVKKSVTTHKMLQANKVLRLARSSKKEVSNLQNVNIQMKAFGQHDLLSIGHNVELELTLLFLLGPVPWSLSSLDKIYIKTDMSKLQHCKKSHIEPTLD